VIADPPFDVGTVKLIVAVPELLVIEVIVGADGTVADTAVKVTFAVFIEVVPLYEKVKLAVPVVELLVNVAV